MRGRLFRVWLRALPWQLLQPCAPLSSKEKQQRVQTCEVSFLTARCQAVSDREGAASTNSVMGLGFRVGNAPTLTRCLCLSYSAAENGESVRGFFLAGFRRGPLIVSGNSALEPLLRILHLILREELSTAEEHLQPA